MENQLAVGERVLADNSENFALVNDNINTADTYYIDNIVTTTAKAAVAAYKESVAEGFSDSLFAKLLGVGHRFSSDIQGVEGEQRLSAQHPHQQREPMMLLEAESMMKLEVLLTSILVILSILSILIILLTLMLSRQWRRSRTKCKLHSPASNTTPSPSHLQLAGVGLHPHNYPLPPPPNGEGRGRGDVVGSGRFCVGQGQQVVDMSSCQVHGAKYYNNNNNTNIWCVDSRSSNPRYSMPNYAKSMGHELATVGSGYYTSQHNLIRSVSAYHTKLPDNFPAANVNGRPVSYHAGPPPLPSTSANGSLLLTPLDLDLERSTSFAASVASQQDGEIAEPIYQEISESVIKKKEKGGKVTHEDLALADKTTEAATKAKETENNESSADNIDRISDAVSNSTKATSGVVYGMITAKQAAKFIPCTQTVIVRD